MAETRSTLIIVDELRERVECYRTQLMTEVGRTELVRLLEEAADHIDTLAERISELETSLVERTDEVSERDAKLLKLERVFASVEDIGRLCGYACDGISDKVPVVTVAEEKRK